MGYEFGPMMWGHGGFWPFGLVFWILAIVAIVALVRYATRRSGTSSQAEPPREASSLNILQDRYARGEIGRDEFLEKRKDILTA